MPPKFYKKNYHKKAGAGAASADTTSWTATYLIIVESPSKCSKIEEFLGSQYKCIATKGHFRQIEGLKSIDTKRTFEPVFSTILEICTLIEILSNSCRFFSFLCCF